MKSKIIFLETIKNLKLYERQQKDPIQTAREIYNVKGEEYTIRTIFIVLSYFGHYILNKKANIEDFKWYFKLLEEAFKLIEANEAAYWATEDFDKCLDSWQRYWEEKNKEKAKINISLQIKVKQNPDY